MYKFSSQLSIAGAFASLMILSATPALALSALTFVSGKGADSGNCTSPSAPCRTFQFALGQTSAGGEIKALDPASYGGLTINKSISITGVEGAGIFQDVRDGAITINAGPNDAIHLSHLILDGFKTAKFGIGLNSGGSLTITHCIVRNFASIGIAVGNQVGAARFLIRDTLVSDSGLGVLVVPLGTGSAQGTVARVLMDRNASAGLFVRSGSDVTVVDSVATNSSMGGQGFGLDEGGHLHLAHSAATANTAGVAFNLPNRVDSGGNNFIRGNGTDVTKALTTIGTR